MIRLLFCCLCLLYTMPSCVEQVAARSQMMTAIPTLRITNADSTTALQISKLNIDVSVTGNIATTTFDITFYNPADKILEGEFDFPLADGQNISRYALEINDHLREGVVVEKVVARTAFEKTIRQKIDPGLVEKTVGNNFRTRIYPIPAKGYKRIVIGTEQSLASVKNGLVYKLPLYAEQPLKEFAITATINKSTEKPELQNNTLSPFEFNKKAKDWKADFQATNFTAGHVVKFVIPENEAMVYTEKFEGKTYFYVHTPAAQQYQDKQNPSTITLLWDVSASGEKRNITKEIALLKSYFDRLENVTVTLVPFNIATLSSQQFVIKNGDANELVKKIESLNYDGGTQLGAINLSQFTTDEILLFTDGMSTFGKKEVAVATTPVTVVNTNASANFSYLKLIALQTHGRFINLAETEAENALDEMAKAPLQFINATYDNSEITELVTQTNAQLQNGFSFAGILQHGPAYLTINYGYGSKITSSKTISIITDGTEAANVKRIWATTKIAQLDLEYDENKAAITQLGKQFSVVTQNTSLIVLDRVEDYVEHEIVPPAELQKEYYVLLKEKLQFKTNDKEEALQQAVAAMDEIKEWYNQRQYGGKRKSILNDDLTDYDRVFTRVDANTITSPNANHNTSVEVLPPPRMPEPPQVEVTKFTPPLIVRDDELKESAPIQESLEEVQIGTINQEGAKDEGIAAPLAERGTGEVADYNTNSSPSTIQLSEWNSEAAYLKELEKTPATNQFDKYLQLKKDYLAQPSFFVDVSRLFYAGGNKAISLQVLSNVAEMKLENPELLRIVANQLMEWNETALAAEVLKEVLAIREEEPQSYRDLAVAYTETGNYQQAVDLLYEIVTGTWDERFFSIKGIALNEMNAIISSHPADVNISAIDKQFVQPMPVDVRIVIGWSSNDSDVDLWVTDPRNEKCFYQNNTTSTGGKISGDITQGYGPEEFCVRKATNGNYEIDVNLYGDTRQTLGGPITIKAELFTNFGKPTQQRKVINCRVTSNKEVIRIGALHFGS